MSQIPIQIERSIKYTQWCRHQQKSHFISKVAFHIMVSRNYASNLTGFSTNAFKV